LARIRHRIALDFAGLDGTGLPHATTAPN
jgi:hypothetical protein